MKIVIAIIGAMIVSSAITFFVTSSSSKNKVQERKESETDTQSAKVAELRKQIAELKNATASQASMVLKESNVKVPGVVTDPADLIDQLIADGAPQSSIHIYEPPRRTPIAVGVI